MRHLGTVRLETKRLILRPFTPEDADAMYRNWACDPEVTKYLTWTAHQSPEVTRQIVDRWVEESRKPDYYAWAIVLKDLGEPIGSISAVRINETCESAEIGYCIGKTWWHQGLTAEALRAVIEYLIRDVGAKRVSALHDVDNPNSGRVMQKAGMRREGVLRRSGSNNSNPCCDLALYSILAEELDAAAKPAFRPLARSRQALSHEECVRILREEKRGVLSVLGDDEYPYGLPIDHWYDPEDGKLYFHSGPSGHKIDAMLLRDKASYCVLKQKELNEDGWSYDFESVIVFGRLEIVRDHALALDISRRLSLKFTQDLEYIEDDIRRSGAKVLCFALNPEHISGKRVHEK